MAQSKSPAALAVAAGIILSRIAGLVRDRVFAYYLGNSAAAGAFKAALRIPNFLQNLFGEGVLSASFIPVYARLRAEGKTQEAAHLASTVVTLLAVVVTVLAAAGTLSAPYVIDILAPGFNSIADLRELTIQLVQIMFPGVALLVLSAWCLGILNSHRRFLLPYVAPVLWNLAIIGSLLLCGGAHGSTHAGQMELARDVAWGTIVGCVLQFGIQVPLAWRLANGVRPSLRISAEPVRVVLKNFLPVVTSRGVVQISAYVDGVIASYLGPSVYSALAYAQQIYLLPVSLFGMSISVAELPAMSSIVGSEAAIKEQLVGKLINGLRRVSFFVIPSVVAMAILGDVVIATIYQTGQFTRADVMSGWLILAGSTVGLLASTQGRLCSTALYALRDTKTPLYCALVRVLLTGLGGYVLAMPVRQLFNLPEVVGAAFLTSSAGVAGWAEFLLLRRAVGKRLGAFNIGSGMLVKLWLLAIGSGGAAFGLKTLLPQLYPVITGVLVLGLFGVLYLAGTIALRLGEGANWRRRLFNS